MRLPDGWESVSLEQCCSKSKGRIVQQNDERQGIPYIGSLAFDGMGTAYTTDRQAVYCTLEDVLILWDGEYAGKSITGMSGAVSSTVVKLQLNPKIHNWFLHYCLQSDQQRIRHVREGSGVPHMPKDFLRWYKISLPTTAEQKQIAEILGSVDATIAATRNVIDQTARLKKALMTELLTRGLPGRHPRFKPSPLGKIPESWKVTDLGKISTHVTSGSRGWAKHYAQNGSLFVRITNLKRDSVSLDLSDTKYVLLPQEGEEGIRTRLQIGDILISITADLGIIGYIEEVPQNGAYINQHIALVRLEHSSMLENRYVAIYLSSKIGQRQLLKLGDAGAKAGLNLNSVRKTKIALPPLEEQKAITEILTGVEHSERQNRAKLAQLQKLKTALMQVLLTGRVRVPAANRPQTSKPQKLGKEAANG